MTHDEMTKLALEQVKQNDPESSNFKVIKVFDNIMDGAVVSVGFRTPTPSDKDDSNHIWFRGRESRAYRWHSDIVNAVSAYKERRWFFRFIEVAGVNGVIAFAVILIFSALLCALLVTHPDTYQTILELVKLSFSVILGYFFGSQAGGKKDS
jgi:hypothetical protein